MGANPQELINPPLQHVHVYPRAHFPVVGLNSLPFHCTEEDVARFFRGLHIVDILFVYKNNEFTGEAFCVLANSTGVEFAIEKNKQKMGRRLVKVFRSRRRDYYKAVANKVSCYGERDSTKHTGVLRLLGLPYSVDKKEIVNFFKDFMLAEDSVHITKNSKGQLIGEAYVVFNNARASKAAMAKDRMMVRDRYIRLFPSSYETLQQATSRCGVDGREMGVYPRKLINPPRQHVLVYSPALFPVVRLRSLPFNCREEDVAYFFRGLDIVDILFVYKNNEFTGDAFCVLANSTGVEFAMEKNKQMIGTSLVKVLRCRRRNYYKAVANKVSYYEGRDSTKHTGVLRLWGLPFSVDKKEIMNFFKDFVLVEESVHITTDSKGQLIGEAFVVFNNAQASRAAMVKDRMMVRDRSIRLFPSSYEDLLQAVSRRG